MATSRKSRIAFVRWLGLRTAVNTAQLAGLDDLMDQRIDRWASRSYDLEREWRGT